jgi:hypothetical protein
MIATKINYDVENLTMEQCLYILKCKGGALFQLQREIQERLQSNKGTDIEVKKRYEEIKNNWELIKQYKDYIPYGYIEKEEGILCDTYHVYDDFDIKVMQRIGCSKKFKSLKEAIEFLWTHENDGWHWKKVKSKREIPIHVKRYLKQL